MLDGEFPDFTKVGFLIPLAKNHRRFRPIHLLETLYKAVDARVARRLLEVTEKLKLTNPAQYGSVKYGTAATPLDAFLMVAEDTICARTEAWTGLLDCSEAFDSISDPITDIIIATAGLPDKFAKWARQAKHLQRRIVVTAGGQSAKEVKVKGGSQGAPTMPLF